MIYRSETVWVIGGTRVIVALEDMENWNDAPTTELTTRFIYRVEGETHFWGYSRVIGDHLTDLEALELYRLELARWIPLKEKS